MKIQLINAPPLSLRKSSEKIAAYPPLGLLYLVSYIRQFKPEIKWKISDGCLYDHKKCISDFKQFKPDIVGVSYTTPFASGAFRLIDEIKNLDPSVKIVAGGAHPTSLPDESLEKVDTVVVGEGERSFLKVIEEDLKGKVMSEYIRNLDTIPFPARDLVDMSSYPGNMLKKSEPETGILSTRGCAWSKCWFCSENWKICIPYYRPRTAKNVVDELEMLKEKYKIREFYDLAEELNVGNRGLEICQEIINRKLDLTWKAQLRCDMVTEELMKRLSEAGCWLVYIGIESGNQKTLDGIKKGIKLEEVENVCRLAHKYGIKVLGFFMFFNVWEENGELRYEGLKESMSTMNYGKKLLEDKMIDYASWQLTTPFPFSPLWNTCMKYDLIPKEFLNKWENWHLGEKFIMRLPDTTPEDIETIRSEIKNLTRKHIVKNLNMRLALRVAMKFLREAT